MPKTQKLLLLIVTLLCSGLIAAGCGDDEEDTSGGGGDTTAAEQATTEESGGGSGGGSGGTSAAARQAAENCKKSIDAATQLKPDTKKELEKVCEEAAQGDADAARKATEKVCIGIAEDTIPAGAARDQTIDACKQATATP